MAEPSDRGVLALRHVRAQESFVDLADPAGMAASDREGIRARCYLDHSPPVGNDQHHRSMARPVHRRIGGRPQGQADSRPQSAPRVTARNGAVLSPATLCGRRDTQAGRAARLRHPHRGRVPGQEGRAALKDVGGSFRRGSGCFGPGCGAVSKSTVSQIWQQLCCQFQAFPASPTARWSCWCCVRS